MNIRFWKMHGAGNDFILVDDRSLTFPADQPELLARLSTRRTGIGADGILLIQPSKEADVRMRFFNPDGGEADMCGNGARCFARLAYELGAAPARMTIETAAGPVQAEVLDRRVRIRLTSPHDWRLQGTIDIDGATWRYDFVNTGVPHVVIETDRLADLDVARLGAAIRWHSAFAPAGTNADFIQVTGEQALRIRTYERGVEGETLACGTGIVAAALIAARNNRVRPPVSVTPASGDVLEVGFVLSGESAEEVTLLGPAEYVYSGDIHASLLSTP